MFFKMVKSFIINGYRNETSENVLRDLNIIYFLSKNVKKKKTKKKPQKNKKSSMLFEVPFKKKNDWNNETTRCFRREGP